MTNERTSKPTEPEAEAARALEERARALLIESANRLDARTQSRLTQARHAALDAVRPARKSIAWWLPASGVAAAAVLSVVLVFDGSNQTKDHSEALASLAPVDDVEIVTAEDSLEFYRDVEFYVWLDTVLEEEAEEASGA